MYEYELEAIRSCFYEGAFINLVINDTLNKNHLDDQRASLFTRITYGVVENKYYLEYQLAPYLLKDKINKDIKVILLMGIYMILKMRLANHHAVDALVEDAKKIDNRYSGMVNKILREIVRNGEAPIKEDNRINYYHYLYSYPTNLISFLMQQYPSQIEDILKPAAEVYNTYRINLLKTTVKEVKAQLTDAYIEEDYVRTKQNLTHHPLFTSGVLVYQDYASLRVAHVAGARRGDKILDMCSAPGSKAFHLASLLQNAADITCLDIYEQKTKLIEKGAKNLGVTCIKTITTDASRFIDKNAYDLVLLDAPCSGLGVMKHKVDLKYHFNFGKLKEITTLQKALLGSACINTKVGGYLVYSTCTINKQENEEMIKYFLKKHANFEKVTEEVYLPTEEHDGFYICKLKKVTE